MSFFPRQLRWPLLFLSYCTETWSTLQRSDIISPHGMSPGFQVVLSLPGVGFRKHAICKQHKWHECEIVVVIPLPVLILELLTSLVCLSTEKHKIQVLSFAFLALLI